MDRVSCRSLLPSPRRRASYAGLTLVEMIVALTIVGIASAVGLPRINNIANQNRVHRAAQGMQLEVQQAFVLAGRNRQPVTLRWNTGNAELQLTNLNGSTIYRRAAVSGYGLNAAEITMTPAVLTVFPNGLAADTLVFRVARGEHRKSVHVSRAGMVRVR